MTARASILVLAASLAACTSARPVAGRPPVPPGVPERYLHFSDAAVGRGDVAPDFTLPSAQGDGSIALSDFRGRPLVLVFGSHTCNLFARDVQGVKRLHDELQDRVGFLLVYVREAHPDDEWTMPENQTKHLHVTQPRTDEERREAAQDCASDLGLDMPTAVDRVDDRASSTYGGWPDRLYVIDPRGKIAYQGGVGPFGFSPDEVRAFLRSEYGL